MTPYYDRDGITLYHGDVLDVVPSLTAGIVDAVITDPPYSSGGMMRSDRMQSTSTKYVQSGSTRFSAAEFSGDNRDQRSWKYWCRLWMAQCLIATRSGGYLLSCADWRQLPSLTDEVQAAGWVWRGIIVWNKGAGARAPAPQWFRHQCEYIAWGTRGPLVPIEGWPRDGEGCYPGCLDVPVLQADKHHQVGKPTALMESLLCCVQPGGTVLDPFAGSCTTGVAAWNLGRKAILCEIEERYCEIGAKRLDRLISQGRLFKPEPVIETQRELFGE